MHRAEMQLPGDDGEEKRDKCLRGIQINTQRQWKMLRINRLLHLF